jgi:hypothetical protein
MKPHLLVAIDPGASAIKVVASLVGDDKCYPFTIDSHCLALNTLHHSDSIPSLNPDFDEKSVWVGIGVDSDYYAVGNLVTAKYGISGTIKQLKSDAIVPKIIAAIAVAHRKFNLPSKFKVTISSVLPPGEHAYTPTVTDDLMMALRKVLTPAGQITPILQNFIINPEGYGVLNWHRIYGAASDRDIGIIMFGYRNTSVLFSVSGVLTNLKSSGLGFHQVLEKISTLSGGGYDEIDLARPVWDYLIDQNESGFKNLSRSKNYELELSMIKNAIEKALIDYRQNLQNWLTTTMRKTDMIVLCGGNSEYIGTSFDSFLEGYAKYFEGRGYMIQQHIGSTAIPHELTETGMAVRYLDIYCLWLELSVSKKN